MNRLRAALRTAALAAALAAAACSSEGAGLNFGCGPVDPCCAIGNWTYNYPGLSACGTCNGYSATSFTLTISPAVAKSGGAITSANGPTGMTFNPATCSASLTDGTSCNRVRTFYWGSNGASYMPVFGCTSSSGGSCLATCNAPVVDGTPGQ